MLERINVEKFTLRSRNVNRKLLGDVYSRRENKLNGKELIKKDTEEGNKLVS